jgi:hypothetical protein
MIYEWGYSRGEPQAVSPLDKVRRVVDYGVSVIPPEKIFLGMPNYGYDWQLPFVMGQTVARSLGNVEAVDLAGTQNAEILFDEVAQSPTFTYYARENGRPVEHVVWFEDARSVAAMLGLVKEYGLRGFAVWNLMRYFPQMWLVVNNMFRIPLVAAGVLTVKDPKDPSDPIGSTTKQDIWDAYHNILIANAETVRLGHEIDPANQVGCMLTSSSVATYPYNCDPKNVFGALESQRMANFYFGDPFCLGIVPTYLKKVWKKDGVTVNFTDEELALIKKYTVDFFSFSYYRSSTYDYDYAMRGDTGGLVGKENPYLKDKAPKPWGWPVDPEGIRYTLNVLYDRYHLPLYIVENGVGLDENLDENGTIEDDFRIHYITEHVKNVDLAIEDGVDCRGYLYWGPIDVVSAGTGEMKKRYGFVYVDRFNDGHGTLERAKKKSYDFMKELCESNGESVLGNE